MGAAKMERAAVSQLRQIKQDSKTRWPTTKPLVMHPVQWFEERSPSIVQSQILRLKRTFDGNKEESIGVGFGNTALVKHRVTPHIAEECYRKQNSQR